MAFRRDNDLTTEQISAFLQDAVSKVKSNPDEFEEFKKIFKKNVPLTMRNFVAAYILKQAGGAVYRFNKYKNGDDFHSRRRFDRDDAVSSDGGDSREYKHERYQHIEIDSDVAATVFVGVGKNRRVYPKDIVGLFISVAGLEKEKIGDIKVYANYSFVQLFKEDADKAINALNGYDYRGRKLSVSYSRQRSDENEVETSYEAEEPNITAESSYESEPTPVVEKKVETPVTESRSFSDMTDEEIMAMRAPRSSSTEDVQ